MHVQKQAAQGHTLLAAIFLSVCFGISIISMHLSLSHPSPCVSHTQTHTHHTVTSCHTFAPEVNAAPHAEASSSSRPGCSCPCSAPRSTNKHANACGHVSSVALTPSAHTEGGLMTNNKKFSPFSSPNTPKCQHSCAEQS